MMTADASNFELRMAKSEESVPKPDPRAGLCARCLHCRLVDSGRSVFYLCGRALTDPTFRKYPPLPVLSCRGFEERSSEE
jgi:hypothetical protein